MNIEKFVKRLGSEKTKIVKTKEIDEIGPKDANDVLILD